MGNVLNILQDQQLVHMSRFSQEVAAMFRKLISFRIRNSEERTLMNAPTVYARCAILRSSRRRIDSEVLENAIFAWELYCAAIECFGFKFD